MLLGSVVATGTDARFSSTVVGEKAIGIARDLTHPVMHVEQGKPALPPSG